MICGKETLSRAVPRQRQSVEHLRGTFGSLFLLRTSDEAKLRGDIQYVNHTLRELLGQATVGRSGTRFTLSTLALLVLFPATPHTTEVALHLSVRC